MPGIKKMFHEVHGRTIMDSIHGIFTDLFEKVIIVVKNPSAFAAWDGLIVTDIYPARCPLAGIHAALYYAQTDHIFVSAGDTPFLKHEIVRHLVSAVRPGIEVVLPETRDGLEPLCAVYSKSCLGPMEKNLDASIYKIRRFFREKKVRTIPLKNIEAIDHSMVSFFNINTPDDLARARALAGDAEHFKGEE